MTKKPSSFDITAIEYGVVYFRNWLYFLLTRGDYQARKYFVIGHQRTGTKSVHKLLVGNNVNSLHSPGLWDTSNYDAFSDRGYYQPVKGFVRKFPNSVFILNTRSVEGYIMSIVRHFQNKGLFVSVSMIRNQILRRNMFFINMLRYFHKQQRELLIFDITKQGGFDWLANKLGMQPVDMSRAKESLPPLNDKYNAKVAKAFAQLGIKDMKANLLCREITSDEDWAFYQDYLAQHPDSINL